ncbi:MAG: hypothetical protein OEZ58_18995 [Gammaproteobacteria bacterium]|nr:hypothetical protein [Gammaproteobacteria bacterium]
MRHFIVSIMLFMLYFPSLFAGIEDSYDKTTDTRKIGWMDRGKDAAKSKLKDPSSAKFRNVYYHKGTEGVPVTCGEVNSKNSFGGYGGYQRFVSAGKPELTFLQEQVDDFSNVWNRFCR